MDKDLYFVVIWYRIISGSFHRVFVIQKIKGGKGNAENTG
jgi:hypothetical protein